MSVLEWFAGDSALRAVFFPSVVRPKMLDIMAGMNLRDIYVAWCLWFTLQKTVDSPLLQFINKVVFLLFVVRG